ncbi:hypothetical protein A9P82_02405 [Arachidicoccus ginsenosidimutans]|uniref:TlpA disulfide reductase family protein n=1 Tax=Arachidicoccus sp. BS20 TaxID=1850526 RepID=UPI0007F0CA72|nr:TlpA disulfide reductase family protein [Arachidicoccus sp. BS20]ANI88254.1 hypothetical protein A9P82_02405 [Arachidicoccus sp. BS20]
MFKKYLWIAFTVPTMVFAQEKKFEIRGKIENAVPGEKVFLSYSSAGQLIVDSTSVINDSFRFDGTVSQTGKAYLQLRHVNPETHAPVNVNDYTVIWLEPGTINLAAKDDIKYARVNGTSLNDKEQSLHDNLSPLLIKKMKLQQAIEITNKNNADTNQTDSLQNAYYANAKETDSVIDAYITGNRNSIIALEALKTYVNPTDDPKRLIALFDQLGDSVRDTKEAKYYNETLSDIRKTAAGIQAPVFSLPDISGKKVSLSDFRGKYVLLDFWASWCMPCRAENPNLVKIYNQYKGENFAILSVSLDGGGLTTKQNWLNAIKKDGLEWTQVSDLQGWKNKAAQLYKIKSVPANFLIDPKGKIIAKNLRGNELAKKLYNLFKS